MSVSSGSLSDLSKYIFGTTRLGDDSIPLEARIDIARKAVRAGTWIHTSDTYGNALQVLRTVFDEDRTQVPPAIFKIGWSTPAEVRAHVQSQCKALDIPQMAIGQICPGGELAQGIAQNGSAVNELLQLKSEGLVGRFVLEVFPWTSPTAIGAIKSGAAEKLLDGVIFYLNPLQRFASNELWDLLTERSIQIVAMRTVAGGDVRTAAASETGRTYLHDRAAQVLPLFQESGIQSWPEFAARYSLGFPNVRATVGATSRADNLAEFHAAVQNLSPLPAGITQAVMELQRTWSDEVDMKAEPWSM